MEFTVRGFPKLGVLPGVPMIGSIIFFGVHVGIPGFGGVITVLVTGSKSEPCFQLKQCRTPMSHHLIFHVLFHLIVHSWGDIPIHIYIHIHLYVYIYRDIYVHINI